MGIGMDLDEDTATRDPRALEKENRTRRRLKGGPGAVAKARYRSSARGGGGGRAGGMKTRKMAAAVKSVPPANSSAPAPACPPEVEVGRMGWCENSRLLAVARGGSGGGD